MNRKPGWSPPSLMARAVALLARREYSRLQLGRRLRRYLDADGARGADAGAGAEAVAGARARGAAANAGARAPVVDADTGRGAGAGALVDFDANAGGRAGAVDGAPDVDVDVDAGARPRGAGADAAEIDRVLDALEERGLLSNARFAASLVKRRADRYGDLRVARELRDGGVGGEAAEGALRALDGTELARAHAVWSRRFDALPTDAAERGRQGRFLQARGFTMDTIRAVLAGKTT